MPEKWEQDGLTALPERRAEKLNGKRRSFARLAAFFFFPPMPQLIGSV